LSYSDRPAIRIHGYNGYVPSTHLTFMLHRYRQSL
jgi:hypothetical protein